jgi:hypothetical protein
VTHADCRSGLTCVGGSRGLLGGTLAGTPYGPPGITLPVLTGREGRCRYQNACGGQQGDACRRADDCCNDDNLTCHSNHCRSK